MAMESMGAGFAEASSYMPDPEGYHVGPDRYLDHIKAAKDVASAKPGSTGRLAAAQPR